MKITFIFPPLGFQGQKVSSMPVAPPVLEYMAGLTTSLRPDWEVKLINANKEDTGDGIYDSDIVGISVLTHQAPWAYGLADNLMKKGITVLLGGPHPTALPDEAGLHCDSVIIGEAESVLEQVFNDIENNSLQQSYCGESGQLTNLPFPRRDLLKGYVFHSYFTSRGCPYGCSFCTTPNLHGRGVRYRPIEDVIKDIRSSKHKRWFCSDPDIWGPDTKRYIELFKEMSRSLPGMMWIGEASLSAAQQSNGDELLYWARKSGLRQVWVGLESFNETSLNNFSAKQKIGKNKIEAIKKIRSQGIDTVLFLMLGNPNENYDDYARVLEECDNLQIAAHPVMIVPYPGTELSNMWEERLIHKNEWAYFDGLHSVIKSDTEITAAEHEEKLIMLWKDLYTVPRVLKRIKKISYKGFPNAHISSLIVQLALRSAFNKYANDWIEKNK